MDIVILKKMTERRDNHFNKKLREGYIRCLGIYPVGTMVGMKSGRVAIIMAQSGITRPIVKFFYSRKTGYISIEIVELSIVKDDEIRKAVSPTEYGIDMRLFVLQIN